MEHVAPLIVEVLAPHLVGGTFLRPSGREQAAGRGRARGPASGDGGADETYRLFGLLDRLRETFGSRIAVHLIDPLSFAWMIRVIRYRPRRYPAFVVGGREVVVGLEESAVARVIASML
jgi:hypothetical protein